MKLFPTDMRQQRLLAAIFVITFVIAVLLTAFFQTQVVAGSQFAARAEENRLRPVVIPAPRGTITDRNGDVVATSVTAYSVSVLPGDSSLIHATLSDLAPFLGLSGSAIDTLMVRRMRRPHDLLEVTDRATFSQAAAVEERRAAFPNLLVVERPRRYYPAGAAVGHLAGYVSEITREELRLPRYRDNGYEQGQIIGRAGVERQYELTLRGKDGARYVEVDAKGRVVDPRASVGALAPQPGGPLQLTLDLALQRYIHDIFPDSLKGAVIAMVPSTGEILAIYSNPGYDPNAFASRLTPVLWRELNSGADKPLLDRSITARYPPASTWKTATAVIGVGQGLVNADSYMPLSCTGGMAYAGRYARCHYSAGHGRLNLAQAIERSCNVYFYQLGIKLGLNTLLREGARIGFNRRTGVDLPAETQPQFPRDVPEYTRWVGYAAPSDVLSFAIGQGANSQTLINMAQFYAAIAGNGTSRRPHLVRGDSAAEQTVDLGLDRDGLVAIWSGLQLVTEQEGTGVQSSLARYKLYGKTGTAQNPQGADHAWFVGFAGVPGQSPEIVVATIIEHGLHGDAAAPLASKAANFYLDRRHGHPFDPIPTWGERIRAGMSFRFDPPGRRLVPPQDARPSQPRQ